MVALFDAYTPIETGGPVASQEEKDTVLASLLPPEYRALLRTISASESGGVATNKHDPYRYMYNGRYAPDFIDHPRQAFPIVSSSPNAGQSTSAAGGYQFLAKTQPGGKDRSWDEAKKALNLPDFSPESQDRAAIWHAENTYKAKTRGRDLLTDIKAAQGKPEQLSNIGRALSGWWTSLPGGIERNSATGSFGTRFANELGAGDTYGGPALYGPNAPISNAIPSNVRETSAPSDSTKQLRNPNMPSGMPAIMGGGGGENDMPSLLRGGLSALQDPETMAYLQMIVKGINPWSNLDPNKALANAQHLNMQREEARRAQYNSDRNYGLEKTRVDLSTSEAQRRIDELAKTRSADSGVFDLLGADENKITRDQIMAARKRYPEMSDRSKTMLDNLLTKIEDRGKITRDTAERASQAEAQGLPGPQRPEFILTGKISNRPDLTPTELNLLSKAENNVPALQNTIKTLDRAMELTPKALTGPLASTAAEIGSRMGSWGSQQARDTKELSDLINMGALRDMSITMKGSTSEREMDKWLGIAGDVTKDASIRMNALKRAKTLAENELKLNENRADQIRGHTYAKPGGGPGGAPAASGAPDPLGIR